MLQKIILITGTTSGIGQAIMLKYLDENYRVICLNRKPLPINILNQYSDHILEYILDLNQPHEIVTTCELIKKEISHINIIVNNAGVMYPENLAKEYMTELQEMMNVNMISPMIILSQLTSLLTSCKGIIINIGSLASYAPIPSQATYSCIKAGLSKFSDIIRQELNPLGIRVVELSPGSTKSNILRHLEEDYIDQHDVNSEARLSTSDVADTCFLITNLSPQTQVSRIVIEPLRS